MGDPLIKRIRVLGHPVHAPLTHFPLALWTMAFLGDILYLWLGDGFWWRFTFWNIALGLGIGSLTIATGFLDYLFLPENRPAVEKTANFHMAVMLIAACLFGGSLYFHRGMAPLAPAQQTAGLVLSAAGTLFLQLGGWLGGQLVYRHGVGYDKEE